MKIRRLKIDGFGATSGLSKQRGETFNREHVRVAAACCVYTCRRLIDLSLIACIYMPAIDRPLE